MLKSMHTRKREARLFHARMVTWAFHDGCSGGIVRSSVKFGFAFLFELSVPGHCAHCICIIRRGGVHTGSELYLVQAWGSYR